MRGELKAFATSHWHALDPATVEEALGTRPTGLSDGEAAARLRRHGPNEVPGPRPVSDAAILFRQLRSPLLLVLVAALAVSVAVGETVDAVVIAAVVVLDATIGFLQERHAESAVRALRGLLAPRARPPRRSRHRRRGARSSPATSSSSSRATACRRTSGSSTRPACSWTNRF